MKKSVSLESRSLLLPVGFCLWQCMLINSCRSNSPTAEVLETTMGNGGDAIFCEPSHDNENEFDGYYSLDYIATFDPEDAEAEPAVVENWQDSLTRIKKLIADASWTMAGDLDSFQRRAFSDHPRYAQVWESAPFGLIEINDEALTGLLPANCLVNGEPRGVQAVIRQPPALSGLPAWKLLYRYVPRVVEDLKENAPEQLSYLMVHEWLWDYSLNVDRNRRINRFLHSKRADTLSSEQLRERLVDLGLAIPPHFSPFYYQDYNDDGHFGEGLDLQQMVELGAKLAAGEVEIPATFEARQRLCTAAQGCRSSWSDHTEVLVETIYALVTGISFVRDAVTGDLTDDIFLQIKPTHFDGSGNWEEFSLSCKTSTARGVLSKCKAASSSRNMAWWQQRGSRLPEPVLFEGRIFDKLLVLKSNSLEDEGSDWKQTEGVIVARIRDL